MGGKYSKRQLDKLGKDSEFQKIIAEDKELERLFNAPRRSRDDRITELALALGGCAALGESGQIPAPCAGTLLLLGVMESPLLNSSAPPPRLINVDVALWVFVNGKAGLDGVSCMDDIERVAAGLCDDIRVDRLEAWNVMKEMTWESFAGMERIPTSGGGPAVKCRFDLAWFASMTSRIAEAANISATEAGWEMPLALGTHYIVALHEKNGGKTYEPNAGEKVMSRLHELMDKRIEEKGYK